MIGFIYHDCLTADVSYSDADPAATITLLGTDVEVIAVGLHHVHELWASIVEMVIAEYLLYKQLGIACAVPIACVFGMCNEPNARPIHELITENSSATGGKHFPRHPCGQSSGSLGSGITRPHYSHVTDLDGDQMDQGSGA